MSRLGIKPISIPEKTEVTLDGLVMRVKGPEGEIERVFSDDIEISISGEEITLKPKKETLQSKALWGTYSSHITNMIQGVNEPYEKQLVVEGVGFKSDIQGSKIVMQLGFSHPVELDIPEGLTVTAEKNQISVKGINKEKVGYFAALIRSKKKPEPYKGKGIRYVDEVIRRKQGKKAV